MKGLDGLPNRSLDVDPLPGPYIATIKAELHDPVQAFIDISVLRELPQQMSWISNPLAREPGVGLGQVDTSGTLQGNNPDQLSHYARYPRSKDKSFFRHIDINICYSWKDTDGQGSDAIYL